MEPTSIPNKGKEKNTRLSLKIFAVNIGSATVMALLIFILGPLSLILVTHLFPSLQVVGITIVGTIGILISVVIASVPSRLLHQFLMKRINKDAS